MDKTKDFKKKLFNLVGNEYSLTSEYINMKTKITIKHNLCGHEYPILPDTFFYKNSRCRKCNTRKLSQEEFERKVKEISNNEYEVRSKYKGRKNEITLYHKKCKKEYTVIADKFLSGNRCRYCTGRFTHEEFISKLLNTRPDFFKDYELLSNYETMNSDITVKHKQCNEVYNTTPYLLIQGSNCFKCSYTNGTRCNPKTDLEFKKDLKNIHDINFISLEPYKGRKQKIKFKHFLCKKSFSTTPRNILRDDFSCPHCENVISKGENKIKKYLIENNIPFSTQKTFKQCKNKNLLPFDFFVKYNNHYILIEYDGIQHFEPIEYFGGEETFKIRKVNDSIKNDFANKYKEKISLLRIPYTEYNNINKILSDYFNKFNDYYVL